MLIALSILTAAGLLYLFCAYAAYIFMVFLLENRTFKNHITIFQVAHLWLPILLCFLVLGTDVMADYLDRKWPID
jgi:hypothetical protein